MKFSLEELRQEHLDRAGLSEEQITSRSTDLLKKQKLKYSGCKKHGALRILCADLGSQKTKLNRWRKNGWEFIEGKGSPVSDENLNKLEKKYQEARRAFHLEPCTCEKN